MSTFDATYIAADSFSVPGDVRSYFPENIAVTVDCGGAWVFSYVESAAYTTITTVTLKTSVLTSPCGNAEVGIHPYMVPWHPHDTSVNSGGNEVVGTSPAYEWNATQIRFRNPDGTWGSWVDLEGAAVEYIGVWSGSSVSYVSLNIVSYNGSSYICTSSHVSDSTSEPGTGVYWATYWALIASKGDQGEIGPIGMNWIGSWETSHEYTSKDGVSNGTPAASYICISSHVSDSTTEPGTGVYWATYWELVADHGAAGTDGTDGVSMVWQSAWLTDINYVANESVSNDGSSYICILGHFSDITTEPGTGTYWTTYWDLVAAKGDQGSQGIQGIQGVQGEAGLIGNWLGPWETPFSYIISDCVENDGSSYTCISAHESDATSEPGTGTYWTTYWEVFAAKGDQGIQGNQGTQGIQGVQGESGLVGEWLGPWETSFSYILNDCVSNAGSSYICVGVHESDATTEPGVGTYWASYWELVAAKGTSSEAGSIGSILALSQGNFFM